MPKFIFQTERLYLREFHPDDAFFFYTLNEDPEVLKYTGDAPFSSLQDARLFLEGYDQYQKYGLGRWAVIDKTSEEYLGWCGLKYSPELNETDLGFRFFRKYWGQGYATEAAQACIQHGFEQLQLEMIVGRAMSANIASVKVLEKAGMKFQRTMNFDGHDGVYYQITKKTYATSIPSR